MRKQPQKLTVRIPNFMKDSIAWRRAIHAAVVQAQDQTKVRYASDAKFDVEVRFHLQGRKLTILDIDNRLKDVLDALQGFIGEKGKSRALRPIIPNDNQIYRLLAEKRMPPKVNRAALSTIVIRRYSNHPGTARALRETRKHVPAGSAAAGAPVAPSGRTMR
jgi:Holliday junction resolvase RusA-like endonuclease